MLGCRTGTLFAGSGYSQVRGCRAEPDTPSVQPENRIGDFGFSLFVGERSEFATCAVAIQADLLRGGSVT